MLRVPSLHSPRPIYDSMASACAQPMLQPPLLSLFCKHQWISMMINKYLNDICGHASRTSSARVLASANLYGCFKFFDKRSLKLPLADSECQQCFSSHSSLTWGPESDIFVATIIQKLIKTHLAITCSIDLRVTDHSRSWGVELRNIFWGQRLD